MKIESNICLLIRVPGMKERKDIEEIFDVIMVELFPDMKRHRASN